MKQSVYPVICCLFLVTGCTLYILNYELNIRTLQIPIPDFKLDSSFGYHKETYKNKKWIIISSKHEYLSNIDELGKVRGWNLLLVLPELSSKINNTWKVTVLTDDNLWNFGSKTANLLAKTEDNRLILGILYLIKLGAKWIYIANNYTTPMNNDLKVAKSSPRLVSLEKTSFNYLEHFGQPDIQPYGYENISNSKQTHSYYVRKVQVVINHLLFNRKLNTINETESAYAIDTNAPPVALFPGAFSPFTSSQTMFGYNALWSMIFSRLSREDITHSYILQSMFKYIDGYTIISSHEDENQMNTTINLKQKKESKTLFKKLFIWFCKKETIVQCIIDLRLHYKTVEMSFPVSEQVLLAWIEDLIRYGYTFPKKVEYENKYLRDDTDEMISFHPAYIEGTGNKHFVDYRRISQTIKNTCPNHVKILKDRKFGANPMFKNILLLVTFNRAYEHVFSLLETMYRQHFPNMLLCGVSNQTWSISEKYKITSFKSSTYSYYDGQSVNQCYTLAMKIGYQVDGYLVLQDDEILNFWHFQNLNRTKLWLLSDEFYIMNSKKKVLLNLKTYKPRNIPIPDTFFPESTLPSIRQVMKILRESVDPLYRRCYKNIIKIIKGPFNFIAGQCDLFFIPQRLASDYIRLSNEFLKRDIWHEVGIQTVIKCIVTPDDQHFIKNEHLHGTNRTIMNSRKLYKSKLSSLYFHPLKLEPIFKGNSSLRRTFCNFILPTVLKYSD